MPPLVDSELRLTDGRSLGYAVWGDPQGRPVMFFPGSPSSRLFSPDPAATAEAGVRLVTVDRPGYVRSDPQPHRRILDWPADVQQLAAALDMPRFAVAAHSSGGPYALACALRLPEAVTGVALAGCVVPLDEVPAARDALDDADRQLVEIARRDPDTAAAMIAEGAAWLTQDPDQFLAFPRPEPDARLLQNPSVRAMFLAAVRESVRTGLDGYMSDEVLERRPWGFRLGDVDVDSVVWHGGQDKYIPLPHAEAMAALLSRCRTKAYPELGHGIVITRWVDILNDLGPGA